MRIECPICGSRDRREFYYLGAEDYLDRQSPTGDAHKDAEAMHRYLHLRENPCGPTKDLWHHEAGCSAWLLVTRDTASHEIIAVELASTRKTAGAKS